MGKIYGYARISTKKQSIDRQIRNIHQAYPTAIIREEVYTGRKYQGREELKKILAVVKAGDTIVFDSVSRMSRNAEEGIKLYFDLYNKGVNLVFIKERHIDTDAYKKALESSGITVSQSDGTAESTLVSEILEAINKFMKAKASDDITKAFEQAQKEVDDLSQRTKEGLVTAKMNGKQVGQVKGETFTVKRKNPIIAIIREKSKDFNGSNTDAEVMAILADMKVTIAVDGTGKPERVAAKVSRNTYYKYKKEAAEM